MTLWDARTYCRKCVEEVSPDLYDLVTSGGQLHDTLDRSDIRAIRYFLSIGKWYLVLLMLVFVLPAGLLVLGGKVEIVVLVFILAFFGGGGMVFLSLAALLKARAFRSQLPRTVTVQNGQLIIHTPDEQESVPLTDCKWRFGSTAVDEVCLFTRLRRGVVIQTLEEQIACGHSRDMLSHWRAFLLLARIPENPPLGCLRLIGVAGTGMIVGLVAGTGIGYAVSMITSNNAWTATLGFMGVLEGAVVALAYASCTSEGAFASRARLHPINVGSAFLVVGVMFGRGAGLTGIVVCGGINAIFGVLVALFCQAKINAAKSERELADQSRSGHSERNIARQ